MASYYDSDDLSNDRMLMLWCALGLHAMIAGVVFLVFFQWDMPLRAQLVHFGNRNLLSLLVLTSASCIVSLIICIAVTGSQLKRSTGWLVGLFAAPVLLGALAAVVLSGS